MTLREQQSKFAFMVSELINFIYAEGYEVTFGDAARMDKKGHSKNSKHYKRLAIDLNLFKDGNFLEETKDHDTFGRRWEAMGGTWGGRFKNPDGNHYQL